MSWTAGRGSRDAVLLVCEVAVALRLTETPGDNGNPEVNVAGER